MVRGAIGRALVAVMPGGPVVLGGLGHAGWNSGGGRMSVSNGYGSVGGSRVIRTSGRSTTRVLRIDCADCEHRDTPVCGDCLVTFLCEHEEDGAVVVPLDEIRAVRLLQDRGLAPRNRHSRSGPWSAATGTAVF